MKLTDAEKKLMGILWEIGEIKSPELVEICGERFTWKKSTTYTILKKLVDKGAAKNENTIVSACITNEEYLNMRKESAISHYFEDSLPQFLNTFIRKEKLSVLEIEELEAIIKQYKEEINE